MERGARERTRASDAPALACVLLVLVVAAAPAFGAIEGSPHDLIAQGYDVVKASKDEERCSRCHITSAPALKDFLPAVPPILAPHYAATSLQCFSCHDGTTIVSPVVDASWTAFHPDAHGRDMAGYEGLGSGADGQPFVSGSHVECVTCHDPHDNGHRPFLRVDLQELCLVCHSKNAEFGSGKENRTGNHPIGADPVATPRAAIPVQLDGAFRAAFPAPYPLKLGRGSGGWHWDLGGHLTKGGTGKIACITCHTVHGDEEAVPVPKLLALEPVNEVANLFCEGCHAGTRGDGKNTLTRPNPGGTTTERTYHPVDDAVNRKDRLLETREPPGWPLGSGSLRPLICTTCHTSHGAGVQTPLLRTTTAPAFCEECHEQVPDYHHPVGEIKDTNCGTNIPAARYGTSEGLACANCHQAHNAGLGQKREADFVPLLSDSSTSGAICALCHPPENPTCGTNEAFLASHFLGDPSLPETYDDKTPPLRTDPWPESSLASRFAGERGVAVVCLSCHSFSKGAVVSGDDGTSGHLLARSGNPVEWPEGGESAYLCAGCHSVDPATGQVKGHSHPMMKASMVASGMTAALPMTATPAGHLNCDSCHRPHEAATASGRYILERARGRNTDPLAIQPQVDYTQVCHGCHTADAY